MQMIASVLNTYLIILQLRQIGPHLVKYTGKASVIILGALYVLFSYYFLNARVNTKNMLCLNIIFFKYNK
jgi:hypothetical protein